ncbi:interphotoreceptor matrix proteoglycan 2 isoform X2 [Myripristis murdjan]|uniref:interphotoreceptor matrix proteoglycan 2 isoform X2 n=1 Tax=Myripristis murdjan TaxID=586833 RepID=UPI001175D0D6|nr:interphotoreceptor matrix proteoglycan 2 isoform X2 [Myripristis murdjan]
MYGLWWKCVFYTVVFSSAVIFLDIRTDAALEGSAMDYPSLPYSQELPEFSSGIMQHYPHITQLSDIKVSQENLGAISRRKRNILFPSGVKLCAQETSQQVAANHLSYFHLRVCQETVWEAFKIFWDRLPEQEEYQSWMSRCQEGTVTAHEIGNFFSLSEEHQALIKHRMTLQGQKSTPTPETPEKPGTPEQEITDDGEEVDEVAAIIPEVEDFTVVTEASPVDNDIAVVRPTPPMLEQVVELSILLTGETYSEELRNPASLQYQTLSRQLTEKIEDSLEGLPGFKSVSVLNFRPQKDGQGRDGVVVDYAVTVLVDGAGVSNLQLDYLTLQSNRVENSYREVEGRPTVVYTVSEVRNYATEALHLEVLDSVSPESVHTTDASAVIVVVDEPPHAPVLDGDTEDEDKDDSLREPTEREAAVVEEHDVIILDESVTESPTPVPSTTASTAGSIEEEGLLLEEEIVQIPKEVSPLPEELPSEPPLPEQPEVVALPEPPVESEASGSGRGDLEDLLWESATTADDDETSPEDIAGEEEFITEEEVAEDVVTVDVAGEEHVDEVVLGTAETPVELEISTITIETIEEEGLPAAVPAPDVTEETANPVPEPAEEGVPPVSDVTAVSMVPALLEPYEEEVTEEEGLEVQVGVAPEAPAVEEETPKAPEILREDLTEDEILLVDKDIIEPPITDFPSPAQPTVLSPERESPFTRISDLRPVIEELPDIEISVTMEVQTTDLDLSYDGVPYGYGLTNQTEEGSTGFPSSVAHGTDVSIALPVNPGRALMVFFSLRVTNMIFSEDLFNKSSAEYKALEQRFLELLVPYLQSNLSNFQNLEILNFRNGSIVVNSRMKFGKPVPRGVTSVVYLILEDFCNTAYQTMNLAIDKYSLDVESGDQADPCKFQACNEYAECKVNRWSGEAECVCNAGYFSVDGLPCQSICDLRTDFCLNDGKCDIIPGQGAICRCRVGENWWYRGEHCEEYVSEPLVVGIAIASVAGFLLVASGVIFFLARTLRDQYDKDESEDPIRRAESLPSLERATKYNPMYESEATTGYSHYYRRYPEAPVYSSASAEASTDFSSEEIRHIYENSELTKEEIQDRIRIIELYAKDRQFADFVRHHQAVLDTRRESSSTHT